MKISVTQSIAFPAFLAAAIGLDGCAAHRQFRPSYAPPTKAASESHAAVSAEVPEPDVRDVSLQIVPEVKPIFFHYDSASLSAQARETLSRNAEWLRGHIASRAQAAGYCDERGTVGYNLALGQRRAQAVKEYYKFLGVPESRVATISYGKEKPVCFESNEACWQKNRKVETIANMPESLSRADAAAPAQ